MPRKPVQDFVLFLLGSGLFTTGNFLFTSQVSVGSGVGLGRRFGGGYGLLFGGGLPSSASRGGAGLMFRALRGYLEDQEPQGGEPRGAKPRGDEGRDDRSQSG